MDVIKRVKESGKVAYHAIAIIALSVMKERLTESIS